jgi:hypothetical protein
MHRKGSIIALFHLSSRLNDLPPPLPLPPPPLDFSPKIYYILVPRPGQENADSIPKIWEFRAECLQDKKVFFLGGVGGERGVFFFSFFTYDSFLTNKLLGCDEGMGHDFIDYLERRNGRARLLQR